MGRKQTPWDLSLGLGKDISIKRLLGFALDRLWVLMMFYSIEPYFASSDVRGSLYLTLLISLCAVTLSLLIAIVVVQKRAAIRKSIAVVSCFAALMCIGSLCSSFSDPNTVTGMMFLNIGAILTGIGSAIFFLAWVELFSRIGSRFALVELALATCLAFLLGILLIFLPKIITLAIVIVLPAISGVFLLQSNQQLPPREKKYEHEQSKEKDQTLSKQTAILFAKALAGVFLFGLLEGFFDVVSGYRTYVVQDIYGLYLFVGCFIATLMLGIIAVFHHRDSIFYAYRLSMLLFCLGCLLTPFLSDNNTYSAAIIFGGYSCFLVFLCTVCIKVSNSFRIKPMRAIGLGIFALYFGEIAGSLVAYSTDNFFSIYSELASVTLGAVSLLFVAKLFLFSEIDLIRIGIGEIEDRQPSKDSSAPVVLTETTNTIEFEILCKILGERYGLSQRESDVLPLLLQGRTISRIQAVLFISAGTVSTHIRHIYQKIGVDNRQELIDLTQRETANAKENE